MTESQHDLDLGPIRRLLGRDRGLSVVSISRPDGSVSSSLINAGMLAHPRQDAVVIGFVVQGASYKRRRLAVDARATLTVPRDWEWQAVEGTIELIGPLDAPPAGTMGGAELLREVFRAAGGTHDDWDEFDRVMAAQQRTAVLLHPERVYGNVSS